MRMNFFKWTFRILIGCAGIGWLLGAAVLSAGEGSAIFPETTYNFGEISETTPLSHAFVVKNAGPSTLNIKDVKPG